MIDADDVLKWLRTRRDAFVNARKVAKAFKISTKTAGQLLRELKERGYLKLHRRRKGRFNIYKVPKAVRSSNSRNPVKTLRSR